MTRGWKTEETFSREFGMSGLSLCFDEAEKEASVKPLPASFMSAGSKEILDASTRLGLKANPAAKGFVEGKVPWVREVHILPRVRREMGFPFLFEVSVGNGWEPENRYTG
jgi:hypothetical protein